MNLAILLSLIVGLLVGALLVAWFLSRRRVGAGEGFTFLQNQLNEMSRILDAKLSESTRLMSDSMQHQFSASQRLVQDITREMKQSLTDVTKEQTRANEATRQFVTIAEQLSNLEKVLKHQKQRGNLGEASLELILSNILPPGAFKMQYEFKDGNVVDAVIITKEGMVPVDAKFSLDNYNRVAQATSDTEREELAKEFKNDLKKRIDETAKYVRPEEGTLPFAFMFIPAEGIYYDLLVNEVGAVKVNTRNLIDYAQHDKKVIIVSPTTFAAYLQSVLYGFKAFKIEESAKDIIKRVDELGKHLKAYEDYMLKLGNTLGTTVNHYNAASKEFGKVDKDITRITGSSAGLEPALLEKPTLNDQ